MTLTVRRWGDMAGMVGTRLPITISAEQQQRVEQEARYSRTQVSFCSSAKGQALMHNATFACFYRPMNHPDHGWIGSYAPPRTDLGAGSQKLSFTCDVSHADARFTECTALYTLRSELDLEYTWIEIRYGIMLDSPTRADLIDQVIAYDNAVRSSFAAVRFAGYDWPAETLARWRAAQPTDESLRRQGEAIFPTPAPK